MESIKLTIKNYRCFSDSNPAVIEIGKGFAACVGQNNSGKSSFLKLFHELRSVWAVFQNGSAVFIDLLQGKGHSIGIVGVYDPVEIFFDGNDRDIEIEFDFAQSKAVSDDPRSLCKMYLTAHRANPTIWHARFLFGPECIERSELKEKRLQFAEANIVRAKDQTFVCDFSILFHWTATFSNSIYIGPFRNAINEGSGRYFDLAIGTSFIETWHEWKTGQSKLQNQAITKVTEDIRHVFEFRKLEINASAQLKTLQITIDDKPYKLPELGAGLAQFIIVFANVMIRKPAFVLIDEPELNLHPALQIDFLTSLASYTTEGIIFATHSLGLARAISEQIFSFRKNVDSSIVRRFEQTAHFAEFLGEMSFSSFQELGYERVLLVEGVTDVRTVQQFLRKLQKDHSIVLLPLGGSQLVRPEAELELAELRRLGARVGVLIDREGPDPKNRERRMEFIALCKMLQFDTCLTERRAIENYLSDRAIKKVKGQKFRALAEDESLSNCENGWSKSENWRIAHEMSFDEIKDTDLGKFLVSL